MFLFISLIMVLMYFFSLFTTPVILGVLLFFSSLLTVFFLAIFLTSWYSYILFLVYIGGLLVLFMYMCIMSSNVSFFSKFSNSFLGVVFFVFMVSEKLWSEITWMFMGFSSFESSYSFDLSLLLGLIVLLLFTFLSVIRIIETKKPLVVDS